MIFFFSATNNSKAVALGISGQNGDDVFDIRECVYHKIYAWDIPAGESVGIVTPTYFLGLPTIVREFLSNLELKPGGDNYIYHVATYGTSPGQSGRMVKQLLASRGVKMNARYGLKMVDTWTPMFDLTDRQKNMEITERAAFATKAVAKLIEKRECGDFSRHKVPMPLVKLYYPTYKNKRQTRRFRVEDTCISCGICEGQCPAEAIEIKERKPEWIKSECVLCLGCLHRCPTFSIQYGSKTHKHGQFVNPTVKP